MIKKISICVAMVIFSALVNNTYVKGANTMIEAGKKVKLDYTLTVDGNVIDSSEKNGPLAYEHGTGTIVKGLERQLEGLAVGDKKEIVVSAEEGYGEVNPNMFRKVQRSTLPQDFTPQVGQVLRVKDDSGKTFPVTVSEVHDEHIVLNVNHPLAGKELTFDVTIVDIQ
jgi:FKBP-type peptidyl-prolyl cis-trans isomerase 2